VAAVKRRLLELELRELELRETYRNMALGSDGALPQTKAIREELIKNNEQYNWCLIFLKWAAGCSLTQSMNDVCSMHMSFHSYFKNPSFLYEDSVPDPPGRGFQLAKKILQDNLDTPSYETYIKALRHVILFVKKAASDYSIVHAAENTGVHPYNPHIIMSKNPHFCELDDEEAGLVMAIIDKLADHYVAHGVVTEDVYRKELGATSDGIDNCEDKLTGKQIHDMDESRGRFLILNHEEYCASIKAKSEATQAAKAAKEAAIAAKHATGSGIPNAIPSLTTCKCHYVFCNNLRPKFARWQKCKGAGCKFTVCPHETCQQSFIEHERTCERMKIHLNQRDEEE